MSRGLPAFPPASAVVQMPVVKEYQGQTGGHQHPMHTSSRWDIRLPTRVAAKIGAPTRPARSIQKLRWSPFAGSGIVVVSFSKNRARSGRACARLLSAPQGARRQRPTSRPTGSPPQRRVRRTRGPEERSAFVCRRLSSRRRPRPTLESLDPGRRERKTL